MKLEIQDKVIIKALDFLHLKNKLLRKIIAVIEIFFYRTASHHIYLISAGIAFNLLLYLIPLLLIAVYLVDIIFGAASISDFIIDIINQVLPPNENTMNYIESILNEVHSILKSSSLAGIIGIISLLWISSTLLSTFRAGLNAIFEIPSPKIFILYKFKDIFLILIISFLLLILTYIFPIISYFISYLSDVIPEFLKGIFNRAFFLIFSIFTSFILFYFLFTYVPNRIMPKFVRYLSILQCIVFVEIFRHLFAIYLNGVTAYGRFYGTYAILASISVWIYNLTLIILFSAEISKFTYDLRTNK